MYLGKYAFLAVKSATVFAEAFPLIYVGEFRDARCLQQ